MMKKLVLVLISLTLLDVGFAAIKVGTVDLEKALQSVKKGKDAKDRLEKKFKGIKAKLDKQEADLQKTSEDLKKKAVVLSDKAKQEQGMAFQQKVAEFQQARQQAQLEMQNDEVKETQPILKGLADMMPEIGKDAGVEMVFEAKAGLLYAAERIDLTDKLVAKFDKK